MKRSLVGRLALLAGAVVTLGVLGVLVLGCALWIEHGRAVDLPAPTGKYAVGRATALWVDSSRADPFAPSPAARRELVVWAWYPAEPASGVPAAPYLPDAWRNALAAHTGIVRRGLLSHDPRQVHAHALDGPPALSSGTVFPVVILRPDLGAISLDYTTLAEDLASHGAVVLAADAPYSAGAVPMPDGRVIAATARGNPRDAGLTDAERDRAFESLVEVWAADAKFMVDRLASGAAATLQPTLAHRLDLTRLGVVGHAFGGAAALQFCHDDTRCRAGADMDGAPYGSVARGGLTVPFLFLMADFDGSWKGGPCPECDRVMAVAKAQGGSRVVTLNTTGHASFSDRAMTGSQIMLRIGRRLGDAGTLDGKPGLVLTTQNVTRFLGATLGAAEATSK